jgi:hypothetical protein
MTVRQVREPEQPKRTHSRDAYKQFRRFQLFPREEDEPATQAGPDSIISEACSLTLRTVTWV